MKRPIFLCILAAAISACASTPVLEPFTPAGSVGARGTVWADNGKDYSLMIKKIDGRSTPSRRGAGFPYSASLLAGEHQLSILVSLSNPNVFIYQYANVEVTVNVEAGHSYGLRLSPSKIHAIVSVIDLGGVICNYDIVGERAQGYVPVKLNCN